MFLYFVRHADAFSENEDPARSLSEKGIQRIKKVAHYMAGRDITVNRLFHSKKLRAMQTAQVLAEHIKIVEGMAETDGLAPMDDPQLWFERIAGMKEDIMLVGHLPFLGRLAALILCGDKEKDILNFETAGIVCLRRLEDNWLIEWMIMPEVCTI